MLKEITLKEAAELMEKGEKVYGVSITDCCVSDLTKLLTGLRYMADIPEKNKGGRPPKDAGVPPKNEQASLTDEEIENIAKNIDRGKIDALRKAGWTTLLIADEFGYTPKTMNRILDKL